MADLEKETKYDEAIALKEKGDVLQAVEILEKLCVDFPDYALPHAALSMIYYRLDQFQKSLEHAEMVCELEPEDPFSFVAMSALAIKCGNHAAAEEALHKAQLAQLRYFYAQSEAAKAQAANADATDAEAADAETTNTEAADAEKNEENHE